MCGIFLGFCEDDIIVLCQEKFEIQDVDNYVERVDNFVDMSEKRWDKTGKIAKKQGFVINKRAWKPGKGKKAVEKVIHVLWIRRGEKNKVWDK